MKRTWRQELISASNNKVDLKAWLSLVAYGTAIFMFFSYGIKGLFVPAGMDQSIRDITIGLLLSGTATTVATLWNQRLGVGPAPTSTPPPPPSGVTHPADLPPEDGPAG